MTKVLILLAAGLSRRFGPENKLLSPVDGLPLFQHTLDKLEKLQAPDTRLLVMTNTREIQAWCQNRKIPWGESPEAHKGISCTIRSALALAGAAEAYVFFVADQPKLEENTIRRLLAACEANNALTGCLVCGDRRGNPVWFSADLKPELAELTGDTGGRAVLKRHWDQAVTLEARREELEDIDLPSCLSEKFTVK